ncbi:DUF1289 domain-containing protein [Streptomyces sp. NPDC050698]
MSSSKPSSPCTKVCVLAGATGSCRGCGRTRQEISMWGGMSEVERRRTMAKLEDRLLTSIRQSEINS